MLRIPKEVVDEYTDKASGFEWFGVQATDLTKEELLACVGFMSNALLREREHHQRASRVYRHLRKLT